MARSGGEDHFAVPRIGDRVEVVRAGVSVRGRVAYADNLQILVKGDDGRSLSVRVGRDPFRILDR